MSIKSRIMSKVSEPYRIRRGWGLSPIRNGREIKALVKFCEFELKQDYMKLNPERKLIFRNTIKLYNRKPALDKDGKGLCTTFHSYVNDNIGFYWS